MYCSTDPLLSSVQLRISKKAFGAMDVMVMMAQPQNGDSRREFAAGADELLLPMPLAMRGRIAGKPLGKRVGVISKQRESSTAFLEMWGGRVCLEALCMYSWIIQVRIWPELSSSAFHT